MQHNKSNKVYGAMFFALLFLAIASSSFASSTKNILISASELKNLLDENAKLVLVEIGWGGPESFYDKGHISGSIHVNSDEIEYDQFNKRAGTPSDKLGRSTSVAQDLAKGLTENDTLPKNWWNLYPDKYLLPAFANMGITKDSRVVVYAKDVTAAARLTWALLYAGNQDVQILNGGIDAWEKAGYTLTKEPTAPTPVAHFGTDEALHPEYLVDINFIRNAINSDDKSIVIADIRTRLEYQGEAAPYSYIPKKGRIKNAKWGKAGNGPWSMDYYADGNGYFKDPSIVEEMWAKQGITKDKHVAFYCGTAWRSSLAFLYAYMLGWESVSNFDSSWYEWSMGPEKDINPIIVGK